MVVKDNILYKCGWLFLEGIIFYNKVFKIFVNGNLVYDEGIFVEDIFGMVIEVGE